MIKTWPSRLARRFRGVFAFVFGGVLLTIGIGGVAAQQPNIVVIMADDLGWKDLSIQGNETLDTPHLDKLAREGIRFTNGYAAAPVCSPTRAAMMTGLHPARLGITNHAPGHQEGFRPKNRRVGEAKSLTYLGLQYETIAERLKEAGYATSFLGKWHLSHRRRGEKGASEEDLRPEHQGFDMNVGGLDYGGPPSYFDPYRNVTIPSKKEGEYLSDRMAEEAIRFIEARQGKPFFVNWWNYSVHYPFQAPEVLIKKYEARKAAGANIKNPTYAAMIEAMDSSIGKLLDFLATSGLAAETFVVFTSDNGPFAADVRPLRGEKGYLYEGGIRVPWIIRWPGRIESGKVVDDIVVSTDLYPTLLELAGLEPEYALDGESLLPLLTEARSLKRSQLFFHYPNYAFHKKNELGAAVREGDYKLIYRFEDARVELYNLEKDIGEQFNLSSTYPQLSNRLKTNLVTWLMEVGANLPMNEE